MLASQRHTVAQQRLCKGSVQVVLQAHAGHINRCRLPLQGIGAPCVRQPSDCDTPSPRGAEPHTLRLLSSS